MKDERQVGFKTKPAVLSLSDLGNSGDWERLERALAEWEYLLKGSVTWPKVDCCLVLLSSVHTTTHMTATLPWKQKGKKGTKTRKGEGNGCSGGGKKKQKPTRGGKAQGSGPGSEVNHMIMGKTRHLDQQPLCPTPPTPASHTEGARTIDAGLLQNIHVTLLFSPSLKHLPRTSLFLTGLNPSCSGGLGSIKRWTQWTTSPVISSRDFAFAWADLSQARTTVPKARRAWCLPVRPGSQASPALLHLARIMGFTNWRSVATPVKHIYQHRLSNSIRSLHGSESPCSNFHNISNVFIITTFVMVICDLWHYYCSWGVLYFMF